MSTLLFELRPPPCCENNSSIPPADLYPIAICEKCFGANSQIGLEEKSVEAGWTIVSTQEPHCCVCGDKVWSKIMLRPFAYPTLTLNLKEVLNLIHFRDLAFDYTNCDYNKVVVKIAQLVLDGRTEMENTKGSHIITANLTYLPETRSNALDHLRRKKAASGTALVFSQEDMIALGLMNALFHLDRRIVAKASSADCSDSWHRWTRRRPFAEVFSEFNETPDSAAPPGGPRA